MTYNEYRKLDALGMAEQVKKREVTPSELLDIAIKRAEYVNPKINAIVYPMYEYALEAVQHDLPEGMFKGVPMLVKDLELMIKGVPTSSGSFSTKGYTPWYDSDVVQKIKGSGMVIIGKANTPEFGLTPYTEPKIYGVARNPWNTQYTTGGSSGGSAAGVAAGIVPIATATDGGGSIRIPASCCGLFGMKPSRGRISLGPTYGDAWNGAVMGNCVSRSVRDSAAFLDTIRGNAPGDPYFVRTPDRPYLEEVAREPGKLRIAFSTGHTFGSAVDHENITAVNDTAKLLQSLGHEVEEVALPWTEESFTRDFFHIICGNISSTISWTEQVTGKKADKNNYELTTWLVKLLGDAFSAGDYARAQAGWNRLTRSIAEFHNKYDVFVTPTLSCPPFKIGELQSSGFERFILQIGISLGMVGRLKNSAIVESIARRTYDFIPYTPIANMTGQPSMSVPLHWTKKNLPVGVMFTGRMCEEDVLYRLAGQLEKAQPWFDRVPEL